jgi:transglutaminase-like putative cysteine protease
MIFKIRHALRFDYVSPAVLGPQSLRLRPREDASQRLLDFDLSVSPLPALLGYNLDENGNVEARACFLGQCESLQVQMNCTVETQRVNPFDFVVETGLGPLPWGKKLAEERRGLGPCLEGGGLDEAAGLASVLAKEAGGDPVAFLLRLNQWLSQKLAYEVRPEGDPQSPAETLHLQRGACRDLAVLFIAACRSVGLPARFVSGYHEGDPEQRMKELHAWAEAWLPGAGWRGFDPSCGLAVADRHVALAAAPDPAGAAALSGKFGASVAGSRLKAEVMFV